MIRCCLASARRAPVAALLLLLLAACNASSPQARGTPRGVAGAAAPGLACVPAAAARWLAPTVAGVSGKAVPKGYRATLYVDRSGSMTGYLAGATAIARPFQDLVETIPKRLAEDGVTTELKLFGRTITPVAGDPHALTRADLYSCKGVARATCEAAESHLDAVLGEVARHRDTLGIVVSDLWFSNSQADASGLAALQPALRDILASGRTVAIYGIAAPFAGRIDDLPDAAVRSIAYTGRHPLFVMAIGDKAQIMRFTEQLATSASSFLAAGMANGGIRQAIFTLDPLDPGSPTVRSHTPLTPGADPRLTRDFSFQAPQVAIQQFRLAGGAGPRPGAPAAGAGAPAWEGPAADALLPAAVWRGRLSATTRIWSRKGESCTPADWTPARDLEEGWEPLPSGRQRFRLDPAQLAARMPIAGTYVLSGEVSRTSLDDGASLDGKGGADAWMRGAWDLPPERAGAVAAHPPAVFPTLNLGEVARLMENALRDAIEQEPKPIVGFTVVVKVE